MSSWRDIADKLTEDFIFWGCRFNRHQLPEIAMSYECTPLFFWNWIDGEADQSEKGFLRVLGYAWKKLIEEDDETAALPTAAQLKVSGADEIAA